MNSTQLPERHESLWTLTISPGIWAAHFMLCYLTAAVYCAKAVTATVAVDAVPLGPVRLAVAVYTLLALAGIGMISARAWRHHRYDDEPPPHDDATAADRHRFLGFATLLLSGLSAVATVYGALPALFIRSCY